MRQQKSNTRFGVYDGAKRVANITYLRYHAPRTNMDGLSQNDLCLFSQCIEQLYQCTDIDAFPRHVMGIVAKLVGGLFVSYTEVNPLRQRVRGFLDPPTFDMQQLGPVLIRYRDQHPLIHHYNKTGDGRALMISDFLTEHQWHQTDLYQQLYRPMQVEDQMSITLPAPQPIAVAMVVSRTRRDFSERDRTMLNLFRPHMVAAYELADRFSRLKHDAQTTQQAVESMNVGLIRAASDGRVTFMSDKARLWLESHLPAPDDPSRLPELLARWVARARQLAASKAPKPIDPLRLDSPAEILEIRWKALDGDDLLLMESHPRYGSAAQLKKLGLTDREADVLYWVSEGKTNSEIGIILGTSPRTVQKHLERIFNKLNVQTRMAAGLRAIEVWHTSV